MEKKYYLLRDDEVVSAGGSIDLRRSLGMSRSFRVDEIKSKIGERLDARLSLLQGFECEALRFGASAWQKGKIKLEFIFIPDQDEPELTHLNEPLDELRDLIN